MSKPLAGQRYFLALGHRHQAAGLPRLVAPPSMRLWAAEAYCLGRLQQMGTRGLDKSALRTMVLQHACSLLFSEDS